MTSIQLKKHFKDWWPVHLVLLLATSIIGIGLSGSSLVGGCTLNVCNSVRSLQWESLTAGLLGLAGGLAVIVSTRKQIFHSESVAQQQRRDFLLADFSKQLVDIENICVACIAFKDRALTFGASDDLKHVPEDIMESLRAEKRDYGIKRIVQQGQSLQQDNLVPLPIQDQFNIMLESLTNVWQAIADLKYGEVSTLAKELELSIDQVRDALIAYRNEVLGLRLP